MITEVPTLCARDFCRGKYENGKRACLAGWSMRIAGVYAGKAGTPNSDGDHKEVQQALRAQVRKSEYYVEGTGHHNISVFNDDIHIPKAELAKVWNATMIDLGFDEEVDTDGKEIWGEMRV